MRVVLYMKAFRPRLLMLNTPSIKIYLVLLDVGEFSTQYSPDELSMMLCVPNPSNSTGCLWLDSGLCIAKPWMLCICYCTKSIKLHRLLVVGFRTVYSQAMDALHLLLYQFHQSTPAAFVGFRTVYSQAMDALHLLLYQFHQSTPAAFVGFRTVYSQDMDALHLPLCQFYQSPTIWVAFKCFLGLR